MKIKGRNVNISVDGKILALSRSCTINIECDITEIGGIHSKDWKRYLAGRRSWSVDETSFVDVIGTDASIVGKTVRLRFGQVENGAFGSDILEGDAICTMWQMDGSVGGMAKRKMKFIGTGGLS